MPGVTFAPPPYCYRCAFNLKPETCGMRCAEYLDDIVRFNTSGDVAALSRWLRGHRAVGRVDRLWAMNVCRSVNLHRSSLPREQTNPPSELPALADKIGYTRRVSFASVQFGT